MWNAGTAKVILSSKLVCPDAYINQYLYNYVKIEAHDRHETCLYHPAQVLQLLSNCYGLTVFMLRHLPPCRMNLTKFLFYL